jgi:hypothetical protein
LYKVKREGNCTMAMTELSDDQAAALAATAAAQDLTLQCWLGKLPEPETPGSRKPRKARYLIPLLKPWNLARRAEAGRPDATSPL